MCLEREDGQERDGDDEQRNEQGWADFLRRLDNELPVRAGAALALVPLDVLMEVLHHHDCRVDHRPDRDRDASETHDVRVQTEYAHRKNCHEHA